MTNIDFHHVSKRYEAQQPLIINDANIEIDSGEFGISSARQA
jgi:ABC-type bacteriocin/lantibiotic exporter with double-glycine peptidase domain